MAQLLSLPDELLEKIAYFIGHDDPTEFELTFDRFPNWQTIFLRNLSSTCRRLRNVAHPLVYRTVNASGNTNIVNSPYESPHSLIFFKRPDLAALVENLRVDFLDRQSDLPSEKGLLDKMYAQYNPPISDGDANAYISLDDRNYFLHMTCLVPCRNLQRLFIYVAQNIWMERPVKLQNLRHLSFPHLREFSLRLNFVHNFPELSNEVVALVCQSPNLQQCYFDTMDTRYNDDIDNFGGDSIKELNFQQCILTKKICSAIFAKCPRLESFRYRPAADTSDEELATAGGIKRCIIRHGQQLRCLHLDFWMDYRELEVQITSLADLTSLEEVFVCHNALALPPSMSADEYAAFFPQSIRRMNFGDISDEDFDQVKGFAAAAHRLPNLETVLVQSSASKAVKFNELKDAFAAANISVVVA